MHISEEARNANVAIPWAIVYTCGVGTTLGFFVQISLAFCMGTDTINILSNPVQQPMATVCLTIQLSPMRNNFGQILLNSFGKKGMLVAWAFIFIGL